MKTAIQVTLYLNQADEWHRRPLHLEILQMLHSEGFPAASTFHAVAGFIGHDCVHTSGLVEAGGNLPLMVQFVGDEEHVNRVLPKLIEMAPHGVILRASVEISQCNPD